MGHTVCVFSLSGAVGYIPAVVRLSAPVSVSVYMCCPSPLCPTGSGVDPRRSRVLMYVWPMRIALLSSIRNLSAYIDASPLSRCISPILPFARYYILYSRVWCVSEPLFRGMCRIWQRAPRYVPFSLLYGCVVGGIPVRRFPAAHIGVSTYC